MTERHFLLNFDFSTSSSSSVFWGTCICFGRGGVVFRWLNIFSFSLACNLNWNQQSARHNLCIGDCGCLGSCRKRHVPLRSPIGPLFHQCLQLITLPPRLTAAEVLVRQEMLSLSFRTAERSHLFRVPRCARLKDEFDLDDIPFDYDVPAIRHNANVPKTLLGVLCLCVHASWHCVEDGI